MDYTELSQKPLLLTGIILLVVWSIIWKGLALWKASHNSDKGWFIAILILNTCGILEIIYYYFISKRKK